MNKEENIQITVEATVNEKIEKIWDLWSGPQHITKWNAASDDWHTTKAENNLKEGGTFNYRMEAKDGSFGFDFEGTYSKVLLHKEISYQMADGRGVEILFLPQGNSTLVRETFDAESTNPIEMQRDGWQAILNNFKKYTESN